MKIYLTSEPFRTLQMAFTNLKSFKIIDIDFIIETKREEEPKSKKQPVSNETVIQSDAAQYQALHDEFTLDDISAKPREKTREEIIAEAEAAAFAEA